MSNLHDNTATKDFVQKEVKELQAEMNGKFERVYDKFKDLEVRLENLEDRIPEDMDQKLKNILNVMDSLAGQFKKFDDAQTLLSYRVYEDHDTRLVRLEGGSAK